MKNYIFIIENNCERTGYLSKALVKDDYEVADYPLTQSPNKDCVYIFSPAKKLTSTDYENILPNSIVFGGNQVNKQTFIDKHCLYFSFMDDEAFVTNNSIITAEATAKIITDNTKIALMATNILVLGYGNLSKALQNFLSPNCKKIAFASFVKEELQTCPDKYTTYNGMEFCKYLGNYDIIINTIPKAIFDAQHNKYFKNQQLLIDLASVSCWTSDPQSAQVQYIHARNLPSIIAPKTAGEELKKSIMRFMKVITRT